MVDGKVYLKDTHSTHGTKLAMYQSASRRLRNGQALTLHDKCTLQLGVDVVKDQGKAKKKLSVAQPLTVLEVFQSITGMMRLRDAPATPPQQRSAVHKSRGFGLSSESGGEDGEQDQDASTVLDSAVYSVRESLDKAEGSSEPVIVGTSKSSSGASQDGNDDLVDDMSGCFSPLEPEQPTVIEDSCQALMTSLREKLASTDVPCQPHKNAATMAEKKAEIHSIMRARREAFKGTHFNQGNTTAGTDTLSGLEAAKPAQLFVDRDAKPHNGLAAKDSTSQNTVVIEIADDMYSDEDGDEDLVLLDLELAHVNHAVLDKNCAGIAGIEAKTISNTFDRASPSACEGEPSTLENNAMNSNSDDESKNGNGEEETPEPLCSKIDVDSDEDAPSEYGFGLHENSDEESCKVASKEQEQYSCEFDDLFGECDGECLRESASLRDALFSRYKLPPLDEASTKDDLGMPISAPCSERGPDEQDDRCLDEQESEQLPSPFLPIAEQGDVDCVMSTSCGRSVVEEIRNETPTKAKPESVSLQNVYIAHINNLFKLAGVRENMTSRLEETSRSGKQPALNKLEKGTMDLERDCGGIRTAGSENENEQEEPRGDTRSAHQTGPFASCQIDKSEVKELFSLVQQEYKSGMDMILKRLEEVQCTISTDCLTHSNQARLDTEAVLMPRFEAIVSDLWSVQEQLRNIARQRADIETIKFTTEVIEDELAEARNDIEAQPTRVQDLLADETGPLREMLTSKVIEVLQQADSLKESHHSVEQMSVPEMVADSQSQDVVSPDRFFDNGIGAEGRTTKRFLPDDDIEEHTVRNKRRKLDGNNWTSIIKSTALGVVLGVGVTFGALVALGGSSA